MLNSRSYDAIIGVTSNDWFHQQPAAFLEHGVSVENRKKLMRSYILNNYENHLREIFLSVENEYSAWDEVSQSNKGRNFIRKSHNVWILIKLIFAHRSLPN